MAMVLSPIATILRTGMRDAGMTQQQLFDLYKLNGGKHKQPNTLGDWLRGKRDIPATQLALLVQIIDTELERQGKESLPIVFPTEVWAGMSPDLEVIENQRLINKEKQQLRADDQSSMGYFPQSWSDLEERVPA